MDAEDTERMRRDLDNVQVNPLPLCFPQRDLRSPFQDWHCETCRQRRGGPICKSRCTVAVDARCPKCSGQMSELSNQCWDCFEAERLAIRKIKAAAPAPRYQKKKYFDAHPPLEPGEAERLRADMLARPSLWHYHYNRTNWSNADTRRLAALCATSTDINKAASAFGRPPLTLAWKARDTGFSLPDAWGALIAPARKPRIERIQLSYPYIAKRRDDHADLMAINDIVPKQYPSWVRADVCQNILLAVLEGEVTIDELRRNKITAAQFIGRFMKEQRDNMLVSIEGLYDDERAYTDIAARPESVNDARLAIGSFRTHIAATQDEAAHESLMRERQHAWHAKGIHLSPDEMDWIYSNGADRGRRSLADLSRLRAMTRRDALFERQHGRCAYCECDMTLRWGFPNTVTRDHIVALSAGGSDDDANLVGACMECNWRKGSMPVSEFLQGIGRHVAF